MFLFPIAVLGVVAGIVFGAIKFNQQTAAAWSAAAAELGLTFDQGTAFTRGKLHGVMGGFAVTVDTFSQRSGNQNAVWTRYSVNYAPLRLGLTLKRQTALTSFTKLFGAQDHEIGDPTFDAAFVIKATDPAAVATYLTETRRTSLSRLLATFPTTVILDDSATITTQGYERNPAAIVSITRRLVAAARTLTETSVDGAALDRANELRRDGNAGEAARQLRWEIKPHPDDVDTRLGQVEALSASGDRAGAAEVVAELRSRLPADPDVTGWSERLPQAEAVVAEPAPPAVSVVDDDPAPMLDDLFGTNRLSFETDALFEDKYRDRAVRWSGVVKRVQPYQTDYDFGDVPGTKVVVSLATIANDLYGQAAVDAVVALPVEAAATVHRGDGVTFEGALTRIDPLMRNLFVERAHLVAH